MSQRGYVSAKIESWRFEGRLLDHMARFAGMPEAYIVIKVAMIADSGWSLPMQTYIQTSLEPDDLLTDWRA